MKNIHINISVSSASSFSYNTKVKLLKDCKKSIIDGEPIRVMFSSYSSINTHGIKFRPTFDGLSLSSTFNVEGDKIDIKDVLSTLKMGIINTLRTHEVEIPNLNVELVLAQDLLSRTTDYDWSEMIEVYNKNNNLNDLIKYESDSDNGLL